MTQRKEKEITEGAAEILSRLASDPRSPIQTSQSPKVSSVQMFSTVEDLDGNVVEQRILDSSGPSSSSQIALLGSELEVNIKEEDDDERRQKRPKKAIHPDFERHAASKSFDIIEDLASVEDAMQEEFARIASFENLDNFPTEGMRSVEAFLMGRRFYIDTISNGEMVSLRVIWQRSTIRTR